MSTTAVHLPRVSQSINGTNSARCNHWELFDGTRGYRRDGDSKSKQDEVVLEDIVNKSSTSLPGQGSLTHAQFISIGISIIASFSNGTSKLPPASYQKSKINRFVTRLPRNSVLVYRSLHNCRDKGTPFVDIIKIYYYHLYINKPRDHIREFSLVAFPPFPPT